MTAERWQRLEQLYHAALAREDGQRLAFLREACGDDADLLEEVQSLLARESTAERFLARPAADVLGGAAADSVQLPKGFRIGSYQIETRIGVGGMGEVYRARDMKLGRDVAIKILPRLFIQDPDRLARFEREARVLAALNHPNIATIHGIEEAEGVRALVLELVEGPTLAERLAGSARSKDRALPDHRKDQPPGRMVKDQPQGRMVKDEPPGRMVDDGSGDGRDDGRGRPSGRPIPVEEALAIARQIAEGLEAAHDRGIIHRDLKPANIKITPTGLVKVLDFGLAKLSLRAGTLDDSTSTEAPTVTVGATREGAILGTPAYMSPEQARGRTADKQTDIWAFACVLYEMLSGRATFARNTFADTVAAIVERDPDWAALPPSTPPGVARLIRRCLEKDPRRRLHDIADARIEIEDALQVPPHAGAGSAQGVSPVRPRRTLLAIAMAAVALGAVAAGLYLRRSGDVAPTTRLSISAPGLITPQLSAAVSPEGRRVAFVSTDASGRSMLWIRELDSLEPRVLAGTEDAAHPFWSPDGGSLGFLAGGKLKRVDASGGRVLTLADVSGFRTGGSWNRDNMILFPSRNGELSVVSATGGSTSTVLTRSDAIWPFFLPDGRHFLFVDRTGAEGARGVHVGSLDSKEATHLLTTDFKAAYADPGYLLFVRGESILAQPFDAARLQLSGEPAVVADRIWVARGAAQASFSVSPTGVLAYVNASLWNLQLTWVDRAGKSLGTVGAPERYFDEVPQISPDGSRIAIARGPLGSEDVWVVNLAGGTEARLTFDPSGNSEPVWSSDGRAILFQSYRTAKELRLFMKDAGGAGSEDAVAVIPRDSHLWDWSRDGRFIVYSTTGAQRAADLWVLPLFGDRTSFPFAQSSVHKTQAQISPDRRWLAYTSYESGRDEVYVQSFPAPGSRRQVSLAGGMQPRWRRDGKELFYLGSDQTLMAVPVMATAGAFGAGRPSPLFRIRIVPQGSQSLWFDTMYDVTPDGQRFLTLAPPEEPGPPITVVLNWLGALRK